MNNSNQPDKAPPTSLTLLRRASCDDPSAWNTLYRQYQPSVIARCIKTWELNVDDSEHASQDVFNSIWRKLAEFHRQRTGSFRKWIRIITDNKCRDVLKQAPLATGIGGDQPQRSLENFADPFYKQETQTGAPIRGSKTFLMRNAMEAIKCRKTPRDWKIFSSIVIDNKERAELAKELGVSLNAVNLVFCRVRRELKDEFLDQVNRKNGNTPIVFRKLESDD